MIGSVRGTVLTVTAGEVLVEDGSGVGWLVRVPGRVARELTVDEPVRLWVHHRITEGSQTLFGFTSRGDLELFEGLLGVRGVGPQTALDMVGFTDPVTFAQMVAAGDVDGLCRIPGVGKKTVERVLPGLREVTVRLFGGSSGGEVRVPGPVRAYDEVVTAGLVNLGFGVEDAKRIVAAVPDEQAGSVEELLAAALRSVAGRG